MGKLSFCCGIARAGKSTFCATWALNGRNRPDLNTRIILSGDSFRLSTYGNRFQLIGEELVRANLITATRALIYSGYDVLIDDTHTSMTSVRQILAIDPLAKCYLFTTPPEVCKERAIKCGHEDLIPSIDRMAENLVVTLPFIKLNLNYEEINAESN